MPKSKLISRYIYKFGREWRIVPFSTCINEKELKFFKDAITSNGDKLEDVMSLTFNDVGLFDNGSLFIPGCTFWKRRYIDYIDYVAPNQYATVKVHLVDGEILSLVTGHDHLSRTRAFLASWGYISSNLISTIKDIILSPKKTLFGERCFYGILDNTKDFPVLNEEKYFYLLVDYGGILLLMNTLPPRYRWNIYRPESKFIPDRNELKKKYGLIRYLLNLKMIGKFLKYKQVLEHNEK